MSKTSTDLRLDLWTKAFLGHHSPVIHDKLVSMKSLHKGRAHYIVSKIMKNMSLIIDHHMLFTIEDISNNMNVDHHHIFSPENHQKIIEIIKNKYSLVLMPLHRAINEAVNYICRSIKIIDNDIESNKIMKFYLGSIYKIEFLFSYDLITDKSTIMIKNQNNDGFIYKPYGYYIDRNLSNLYNIISKNQQYNTNIKRIFFESMTEGAYEKIIRRHKGSIKRFDRKNIYHDLGKIMAFSMAMGITDRHIANFIFTGKEILQIDMETAFNNKHTNIDKYCIGYGLRNVMIKNSNIRYYPSIFDSHPRKYICYNPIVIDLSPIRIGYKKYYSIDHEFFFPLIDSPYKKIFWAGYEEMHKNIKYNLDFILEFLLRKFENKSIQQRVLISSSRSYRIALSIYEKNLSLDKRNISLIDSEWFVSMFDRDIKGNMDIIKYESEEIMSCRMPYFFRKSDSCDLWSQRGCVVPNFYEEGLMISVIRKIDNLPQFVDIRSYLENCWSIHPGSFDDT
ncbi:MAG: DUF4135 domain-containing protein [Alphaproteobacteria bacterium GM202ARS2]|nr:DUF4135 domain-containing protein [Alphaproteobacteria bacterium GM202ARS2]